MEILLYDGTGKTGQRIKYEVEACFPEGTIAVFDSPALFLARLRQPISDVLINILVISSRRELEGFMELKNIIGEMRTILILPDRTKKIITQALQFYPRFVGYKNDLQDLSAVLRKIGKMKLKLKSTDCR